MRLIKKLGDWFDARLQLATPIRETMEHPVPRQTASWAYVFGSAALTVFVLQLVTGILLALLYVPSAGEAWNSLQILNHQVTLGWFIRALHGWGSNFMVAIVLIHMVQVFLFGAYKFPRELTWIVGILLLLLTLGMAFTGQVLRFDQDAYWGLGIGASISSRIPVLGPWIVNLLLGGPIIAGATLSRFFALHVFVIPGSLIAFVGLHLLLVLKLGINEWPMPGRIVRRATYVKEYHELTHKDGIPFVPGAIAKDMFFSGFILLCDRRMRRVFRPVRTERAAGSHDYPDRAAAGLLLPVALCGAVPAAAIDGNSGAADRPGDRAGRASGAAVFLRGRREKLEAPAHRGSYDSAGGGRARHVHTSGRLCAVESGDGCVERRTDSGTIPERPHGAGAARGARFSSEAVPQLPRAGRRGRRARAGTGSSRRSSSRRIN